MCGLFNHAISSSDYVASAEVVEVIYSLYNLILQSVQSKLLLKSEDKQDVCITISDISCHQVMSHHPITLMMEAVKTSEILVNL